MDLAFAPWNNKLNKALSIVLVIAIIKVVWALVYVLTAQKLESSTDFYILGPTSRAAGYPKVIRVGEQGSVIVGIINREHEMASYRIEVKLDGVINDEIGPLVLKHDEEWQGLMSFTPDSTGDNEEVEFLLYRDRENRHAPQALRLWINVEE